MYLNLQIFIGWMICTGSVLYRDVADRNAPESIAYLQKAHTIGQGSRMNAPGAWPFPLFVHHNAIGIENPHAAALGRFGLEVEPGVGGIGRNGYVSFQETRRTTLFLTTWKTKG